MQSRFVLMNTIAFRNTSKYQSKCLARRKIALINTKSCICEFCIWPLPSALPLRRLPWVSQGCARGHFSGIVKRPKRI
eukprot:3208429-Pyramimonas_sp.AAC.1